MGVGTTTYNGATTTDDMIVDGYINQGEYIQEFCTTPEAEATQIAADTVKGCNRYAYIEDANGVIDFVRATQGTTSYFRIRAGAAGTATAAGDGMGIGWYGGIFLADLHRTRPAMEWVWKQASTTNASSTFIVGGITNNFGTAPDFAAEPAQGFYVMATSTQNWLLACNPHTGATSYVDTGIATSTSANGTADNFVHFRLEISGTANTAVSARLLGRTVSSSMSERASCTLNLSSATQSVAPTVSLGKSSAGTTVELHVPWVKFWYRTPLF
jgi:hypothetical protein